jgi:hypothetical protein
MLITFPHITTPISHNFDLFSSFQTPIWSNNSHPNQKFHPKRLTNYNQNRSPFILLYTLIFTLILTLSFSTPAHSKTIPLTTTPNFDIIPPPPFLSGRNNEPDVSQARLDIGAVSVSILDPALIFYGKFTPVPQEPFSEYTRLRIEYPDDVTFPTYRSSTLWLYSNGKTYSKTVFEFDNNVAIERLQWNGSPPTALDALYIYCETTIVSLPVGVKLPLQIRGSFSLIKSLGGASSHNIASMRPIRINNAAFGARGEEDIGELSAENDQNIHQSLKVNDNMVTATFITYLTDYLSSKPRFQQFCRLSDNCDYADYFTLSIFNIVLFDMLGKDNQYEVNFDAKSVNDDYGTHMGQDSIEEKLHKFEQLAVNNFDQNIQNSLLITPPSSNPLYAKVPIALSFISGFTLHDNPPPTIMHCHINGNMVIATLFTSNSPPNDNINYPVYVFELDQFALKQYGSYHFSCLGPTIRIQQPFQRVVIRLSFFDKALPIGRQEGNYIVHSGFKEPHIYVDMMHPNLLQLDQNVDLLTQNGFYKETIKDWYKQQPDRDDGELEDISFDGVWVLFSGTIDIHENPAPESDRLLVCVDRQGKRNGDTGPNFDHKFQNLSSSTNYSNTLGELDPRFNLRFSHLVVNLTHTSYDHSFGLVRKSMYSTNLYQLNTTNYRDQFDYSENVPRNCYFGYPFNSRNIWGLNGKGDITQNDSSDSFKQDEDSDHSEFILGGFYNVTVSGRILLPRKAEQDPVSVLPFYAISLGYEHLYSSQLRLTYTDSIALRTMTGSVNSFAGEIRSTSIYSNDFAKKNRKLSELSYIAPIFLTMIDIKQDTFVFDVIISGGIEIGGEFNGCRIIRLTPDSHNSPPLVFVTGKKVILNKDDPLDVVSGFSYTYTVIRFSGKKNDKINNKNEEFDIIMEKGFSYQLNCPSLIAASFDYPAFQSVSKITVISAISSEEELQNSRQYYEIQNTPRKITPSSLNSYKEDYILNYRSSSVSFQVSNSKKAPLVPFIHDAFLSDQIIVAFLAAVCLSILAVFAIIITWTQIIRPLYYGYTTCLTGYLCCCFERKKTMLEQQYGFVHDKNDSHNYSGTGSGEFDDEYNHHGFHNSNGYGDLMQSPSRNNKNNNKNQNNTKNNSTTQNLRKKKNNNNNNNNNSNNSNSNSQLMDDSLDSLGYIGYQDEATLYQQYISGEADRPAAQMIAGKQSKNYPLGGIVQFK